MNEELREQIHNNLKLKDIYELLEIWRINNRVVWSDTTFEVLREILKEKMREIPLQEQPILKEEEEIVQDNKGLKNWEVILLNKESQPELYNPAEVITFGRNVNRLAIAVAVVYILLAFLNSQALQMYLQGTSLSFNDITISFPNILTALLYPSLQIVFTYFPLKALAHILRILMEMEFNSRKS
jgi:hypothetical protein